MIPISIEEIKSSLGERQTTPAELFDDDDGRIAAKTGISSLNRSSKTALQLGIEAVRKLEILEEIREKISFVVYVTQSATYYLPNHASRIQEAASISKEAMCFDINQGCSGFVQALYVMNSLLSDSEDLGLIVCSDTYSQHLSSDDRATQVLFSDGATATVVSAKRDWEIISAKHLTDGSGADLLAKIAWLEQFKFLPFTGAALIGAGILLVICIGACTSRRTRACETSSGERTRLRCTAGTSRH